MSIIIVNDLLTYVFCKLNSVSVTDVIKIIKDFYSVEKIAKAHRLLNRYFPEMMLKSSAAHIEDIINFLQKTPHEMLPILICSNNFNIPTLTTTPEPADVHALYQERKEIIQTSTTIGDISSTMSHLNVCDSKEKISLVSKLCMLTGSHSDKKKYTRRNKQENISSGPDKRISREDGDRSQVRYVCPKCKYSVELKSAIRFHLIGHYAGYAHQCVNCLELFATSTDIKRHRKLCPRTKQQASLSYRCGHCSAQFASKKSVASHEAYHDVARLFVCGECSYRFFTAENLRTHSQVHTGGVHRCPYCEYGSAVKSRVKSHIRLHTGGHARPFRCRECDFRGVQKCLLEKHMLSHGRERKYACEQCGASFKTKYALYTHRRIHCTSKPFACPMCKKSFKLCTQMKVHYRTHFNVKPYACTECNYRARFPILLRKHSRRHRKYRRLTVNGNLTQKAVADSTVT